MIHLPFCDRNAIISQPPNLKGKTNHNYSRLMVRFLGIEMLNSGGFSNEPRSLHMDDVTLPSTPKESTCQKLKLPHGH